MTAVKIKQKAKTKAKKAAAKAKIAHRPAVQKAALLKAIPPTSQPIVKKKPGLDG